ncbi:cyclin-D5-1-like isoform X2 [Solanum dulcamara]|uniref:cyclin-D5-1-like isoform X2 n=1 Tax=Solanum dulcamara TaxID=45834 RepID=UPI002485FF3C|nr:cyclin-D5-1-like isoform X2 [Solanum dulcamara]
MAEDWGEIFSGLLRIDNDQLTDYGEDNEDYVESMLTKEDTIAIAGLTNRLSSRTTEHPWLHQVRHTAIHHIVHTGGRFGVRKITVYAAVIYVDRLLSSMPIVVERFEVGKLLGVACLFLAAEHLEEYEDQPDLSDYEYFVECSARSITNMRNHVVKQFGGIVKFVTPIHFIKYFLSKFCRDFSRKEYARFITVEIIMSILGDVRLMSLRAFVVGAAATLLGSNPNILTEQMIRDEINALPTNWRISLVGN